MLIVWFREWQCLNVCKKVLQPCKKTGHWSRQGGTIGGMFFWEPDILPSGIWIVKIACKCLASPQFGDDEYHVKKSVLTRKWGHTDIETYCKACTRCEAQLARLARCCWGVSVHCPLARMMVLHCIALHCLNVRCWVKSLCSAGLWAKGSQCPLARTMVLHYLTALWYMQCASGSTLLTQNLRPRQCWQ